MRKCVAVICLLLGILSLWKAEAASEPSAKIENVRTIAKGAFSAIQEPTTLVVSNQVQWAELWTRHSKAIPTPPVPKIDFDKESVIFVSLGRKNSGGYSIAVDSIEQQEGGLVVHVSTKSPPRGSMSIQALTAPFDIVAVPKLQGKVTFQTSEKPEQKKPAS